MPIFRVVKIQSFGPSPLKFVHLGVFFVKYYSIYIERKKTQKCPKTKTQTV